MKVSEVIQSSRRVLVPSPTHIPSSAPPLPPPPSHTGISRCTLLFQRMTIKCPVYPRCKTTRCLTASLCSSTSPKPLSLWGPSGINDRFEVPNHLACLGHILPILLVIRGGGPGKESYRTIPYYPLEPLPLPPLPNPTFHFPFSHLKRPQCCREDKLKSQAPPRHLCLTQSHHSSCWLPSPTAILPVLSLLCILTSCHPHALVGDSCVDL